MSQEHRFFVASASSNTTVELTPRDHHHAATVLRLRTGAPVTIVSREHARAFHGTIESVEQDRTSVRVGEPVNSSADASTQASSNQPAIHLIVGLPKGDLPEWIAEKATELGATSISFFQADRSVVKLKSPADAQKKQLRLTRTVEDAAKQSKRSDIPEARVIDGLETALHALPTPINIFMCTPGPTIPSALRHAEHLDRTKPIALVIGPEGDLSPAEKNLLIQLEAAPLALGTNVLRVETAAICALAHFKLALS